MRETETLFENVVPECFPKFTNGFVRYSSEAVQIFSRINTEKPEREIFSTESKKKNIMLFLKLQNKIIQQLSEMLKV